MSPAQICAQRLCVCDMDFHAHAFHLFNHLSDFPLLAFQHVIQMVDLFFQNSHLLLQLLSPKVAHRQLQLHYTILLAIHIYKCIVQWVFKADLCSPLWPSSLIFRSSRNSSSRLQIASLRVPLSFSIPPNSLWSSSMRLSFLSLSSFVSLNFSSWSLRRSLSLLPSVWRKSGVYFVAFTQLEFTVTRFKGCKRNIPWLCVTCSLSFSSKCFFSASCSCAYRRLLTSLSLFLSSSSSAS